MASAFLQSINIQRPVFVLPPKERRIPGIIWRQKKPCYGLADASRGFHLSLTGKLTDLGCETTHLDPAFFTFQQTQCENFDKEPAGIIVSHVDDILHTGTNHFDKSVMGPLKKAFKFGSEEEEEFRYVGMKITQFDDKIVVDYDHYLNTIEVPDVKDFDAECGKLLCPEGQTEYRSVVAKLNTVGYQCRPDMIFDTKVLNSKVGKAEVLSLKSACKNILKLKSVSRKMIFPKLHR